MPNRLQCLSLLRIWPCCSLLHLALHSIGSLLLVRLVSGLWVGGSSSLGILLLLLSLHKRLGWVWLGRRRTRRWWRWCLLWIRVAAVRVAVSSSHHIPWAILLWLIPSCATGILCPVGVKWLVSTWYMTTTSPRTTSSSTWETWMSCCTISTTTSGITTWITIAVPVKMTTTVPLGRFVTKTTSTWVKSDNANPYLEHTLQNASHNI